MAKKVMERIFTTIQIVLNVLFAGVCIAQFCVAIFDRYASVSSWDLVIVQVMLIVGINLINSGIRKLIRNY